METKDFVVNKSYKRIHDSVHGYISISNLAQRIIDNPIFQRLRKLKQLGSCLYVFPNAVHTRFEHSVGTYYLAGRLLDCIVSKTNPSTIRDYLKSIPELKNYYNKKYEGFLHILDDYICELIKIAALCHDIGHGPFSHVFDDYFLPKVNKTPSVNDLHEERSSVLIEILIKEDNVLNKIITDDEIKFIKNLINPSSEHSGFLYQIVSNNLNGLDVDKYDYIARDTYMLGEKTGFDHAQLVDNIAVIDNNICYPGELPYEAFRLFRARYDLHKKIYCHKSVISSQLMLIELFFLLDPILKISGSVENMEKFCKMTDEYILTSVEHLTGDYCTVDKKFSENIKKAKNIIERINNHDLFVFIGKHISDKKTDISPESFIDMAKLDKKIIENLIVFKSNIGYVSGNKKSPLNNLFTCSTKEERSVAIKVDMNDVSHLIPKTHQEHITMIFYKNRTDRDTINALKQAFIKIKDKLV